MINENQVTIQMLAETLSRVADCLIEKDKKNKNYRKEVQNRVKPYLDNKEYGKAIIMYRCLMDPNNLKSSDKFEEMKMNQKSKFTEKIDNKIQNLKEKGFVEEEIVEIIDKYIKGESIKRDEEEKKELTKKVFVIEEPNTIKILLKSDDELKVINEQRRMRKFLRKRFVA